MRNFLCLFLLLRVINGKENLKLFVTYESSALSGLIHSLKEHEGYKKTIKRII